MPIMTTTAPATAYQRPPTVVSIAASSRGWAWGTGEDSAGRRRGASTRAGRGGGSGGGVIGVSAAFGAMRGERASPTWASIAATLASIFVNLADSVSSVDPVPWSCDGVDSLVMKETPACGRGRRTMLARLG